MYNNTNERGLRRDNNPNSGTNPSLPASEMPMTYGQSAASGPAPNTAGHHKHDFLNKIDPAVDSTRDSQLLPPQNNDIPKGTYGRHKSRIANVLDPRVDSDMDSSRRNNPQQQHFSGGPAAAPPVMHGASGSLNSSQPGGDVPESTYGPHSNRMANAMDPRVDSDADRTRAMPAKHGMGATSTTNNHNMISEGTYGPHSSRTGNAMDPRVDSDADRHHRRGMGGATGMEGAGAAANLPGPAPNTAGPHKSDWMNKLDPRVDSKGGMTYRETERRGL